MANNILKVKLGGELDHHAAATIKKEIDAKLDKNPAIKIIEMDFSEVNIMDSSGIGLILGRYKRVKQREGKLIAKNANSHVMKILSMAGLLNVIEIV